MTQLYTEGLEKELRLASFVPRWSIVKTLREQCLADHQWHVAMIAWRMVVDCELTGMEGFRMDNLLLSAMTHDLEEIISADIPSPANKFLKRTCPDWKPWLQARTREFFPWYVENPTDTVKLIVSIADLLEAVLFLSDEMERGNSYVAPHREYLAGLLSSFIKSNRERFGLKYSKVESWVGASMINANKPAKVLGTMSSHA